jgi:hypothetical protein
MSRPTITLEADTNYFELRMTQNQDGNNHEYMTLTIWSRPNQSSPKLKGVEVKFIRGSGLDCRSGSHEYGRPCHIRTSFQCSRYRWKAKEISFPTQLVPHQICSDLMGIVITR